VFEDAFRREHELHNKDSHATKRLISIRQKGRVSQYTTDFNKIVLELPGIPNSILRDIYIEGLTPSIRRVVKATQDALDLAGAQARADRLDTIDTDEDALLRQLYRNSTVRPELPRPRGNGYNGSSSSGPTPMDLGAMRMRRRGMYVPPRLTPQWHNRHTARLSTGSRAIMQAVTAGPYSSNRPSGSGQGSGQARWGDRRQGANPQAAAARFPSQGNGQRRRQ
jgi:hypothetical protein